MAAIAIISIAATDMAITPTQSLIAPGIHKPLTVASVVTIPVAAGTVITDSSRITTTSPISTTRRMRARKFVGILGPPSSHSSDRVRLSRR
jgi:hypothetical protein